MYTAPALLAALVLPAEPPYAEMLFSGGTQVLVTNVCVAVLFPYFGVFMLALGTLLLPAPLRATGAGLAGLDVEVLRFFGGAAILVIAGFALGLASLLRPWVTVPIFCAVLYLYFLRNPRLAARLGSWVAARDLRSPSGMPGASLRYCGIFLRAAICALVLFLLLTKGILVNLYTSDVIQLYFPYLAEVRYRHGIWLDPAHPVISDFLIGRGNGVHLFLASFTNQFVIQLVSLVYLVAISLVVHRIIYRLMPPEGGAVDWSAARGLLPDCALLVALTTPVLSIEFAKYHMQTGALLMFLGWGALLFLFTDASEGKWLFRMLLPVAIVIPLTLPQYQALAMVILAVAAFAVALCRGVGAAKYHLWLAVAGSIATIGSLAFNQLYVGIGELNPAFLFLRYADLDRLQKWTSVELIQYVSFAQDIRLTVPALTLGTAAMLAKQIAALFVPANAIRHLDPYGYLLIAALFFGVVARFRIYRHLAVVAAATLVMTAILLWWGGNAPAGAPLPRAALALPLFSGFVLSALGVLLLDNIGARLSGAESEQSGLIAGSRAAAFVAAHFLLYAFGWLVMALVHQGSIARVMEFQAVYHSIALFVAVAVVIRLIVPRQPAANARERPGVPWRMGLPIAAAGLTAWVTVRFAVPAAFPSGARLWIASLAVSFVFAVLLLRPSRRLSENPTGNDTQAFTAAAMIAIGAASLAAANLYEIDGGSPMKGAWKREGVLASAQRALGYFAGKEGLIDANGELEHYGVKGQWDFRRCMEIDRLIPGTNKVLALNAVFAVVPCQNSPLTARGRFLHHYESVIAPYYGELLFGAQERAYAVYHRLGVNFFYVAKDDIYFWGPGFSDSFNPENLTRHFDIYHDDPGFMILTWRGNGKRHVPADVAAEIERLRARARAEPDISEYWLGVLRLKAWLAGGAALR
ncbi:MAG: hypothetical protein WBM28_13370 [Burkholderiales bacterium]